MISKKYLIPIMIACLVITIYGLITGRFFFLFLIIPLGFLFKNNKKD